MLLDSHEIILSFDHEFIMLRFITASKSFNYYLYNILDTRKFHLRSDDECNASDEEAEEDYAIESAEWGLPRLKGFWLSLS